MFRQLDRVVLKKDMPLHHLYRGAAGTILNVHAKSGGYDVEFNTSNGKPSIVLPLNSSAIRALD